jgi:hypothetical protein
MPYEKVVLQDGTEVLFAMPEDPEATATNDADTQQRDTARPSALPREGAFEHALVK